MMNILQEINEALSGHGAFAVALPAPATWIRPGPPQSE